MNNSVATYDVLGREWTRTENQVGIVGYHGLVRGWRVSVFLHDNRSHYWLRVEEQDIDSAFVIASRDEVMRKLAYLLEEEDNDMDDIVSKGIAVLSSRMSDDEKRHELTRLIYKLVKGRASNARKRVLKELVCAHDDLEY